jgi:hypothetical protein
MRPTVLLRAPSPSRIRRFHWQWLRTGRLAGFAEGHVLRASAADPFAEVRDGEIVPIPQSAPALRARAVLDEVRPGHHEISQGAEPRNRGCKPGRALHGPDREAMFRGAWTWRARAVRLDRHEPSRRGGCWGAFGSWFECRLAFSGFEHAPGGARRRELVALAKDLRNAL